jgi:hypothetical protein
MSQQTFGSGGSLHGHGQTVALISGRSSEEANASTGAV